VLRNVRLPKTKTNPLAVKFVLVALADRSDAKGSGRNAYPSINLIAKQGSTSRSTVKRALAELEALGLITEEVAECQYRPRTWRIEIAAVLRFSASSPSEPAEGSSASSPSEPAEKRDEEPGQLADNGRTVPGQPDSRFTREGQAVHREGSAGSPGEPEKRKKRKKRERDNVDVVPLVAFADVGTDGGRDSSVPQDPPSVPPTAQHQQDRDDEQRNPVTSSMRSGDFHDLGGHPDAPSDLDDDPFDAPSSKWDTGNDGHGLDDDGIE
jgi:hypothetical protein